MIALKNLGSIVFDFLLGAFLLLSLTILIPGRIDGDEVFCFWAFVIITVASFWTPPRRKLNLIIPSLLLLFAIVTMIPHFQNKGIRMMVINSFVGFCALKSIGERIEARHMKAVGVASAIFIWASCIMLLAQIAGFQSIYTWGFEGLGEAGLSTCPWLMGASVALVLPFMNWATFIFAVPLILKAHSTSTVLAIIAAAITGTLAKDKKKLLWVALPCVIGFLAFYFYDGSIDKSRIEIWTATLPYLTNHLIGVGPGTWAHMAFAKWNGSDWVYQRWAHNEFYQQYFEQGLIGLSLMLFWVVRLMSLVKNPRTLAALAALFVLCFFNPVLHFGRLAFLSVVILSFAEAEIADRIRA